MRFVVEAEQSIFSLSLYIYISRTPIMEEMAADVSNGSALPSHVVQSAASQAGLRQQSKHRGACDHAAPLVQNFRNDRQVLSYPVLQHDPWM